MEQSILSEVIEVEKEIQKRLDLERAREHERLEKVKQECEEDIAREEEKIEGSFARSMEDAQKEAEYKASLIIKDAAAESERLKNLDSDALTEIIVKHLHRILPV